MAIGPKVTMILEKYTETLTSTRSPSHVWRPLRKLRGTLQTVRGDTGVMLDRRGVTAEYEFMIDTTPGLNITEKDRIRFGTRYFEIKLIENPMERSRYQILFLRETKREQAES